MYKALLILLVTCSAYSVKAQRADSANYNPGKIYYWGGFLIGGGTYLLKTGLEANALFNNSFVLKAKATIEGNDNLFSNPYNLEADEYAVMAGIKLTHNSHSNFILSTGLSVVRVVYQGALTGVDTLNLGIFGTHLTHNYAPETAVTTIGLPISLDYLVVPGRHFAFNFGASANLNKERSFFSLTFGLAFGHIRDGEVSFPHRNRPMWH